MFYEEKETLKIKINNKNKNKKSQNVSGREMRGFVSQDGTAHSQLRMQYLDIPQFYPMNTSTRGVSPARSHNCSPPGTRVPEVLRFPTSARLPQWQWLIFSHSPSRGCPTSVNSPASVRSLGSSGYVRPRTTTFED
jgi:hypothetical protein